MKLKSATRPLSSTVWLAESSEVFAINIILIELAELPRE